MRAAVLAEPGLSVREWEEPVPAAGEARVAMTKAGVCGSDVHFALDGSVRPAFLPIVLGHEPAGLVESLGPATAGPAPGTRVAIVPLVTCARCDRCRAGRTVLCRRQACLGAQRHGCWADYVTVPVRNLIPLPNEVDDAVGAVATDCVGTALHAVRRGGVGPGSRVAIWGAGGLGLAAVGVARSRGAARIVAVDPRPAARERALAAGADTALAPEAAPAEIAASGGVEVALEFVGSAETLTAAVRSLDAGGRAVAVGLGRGDAGAGRLLPFVSGELELVGSYGAEPDDIREAIAMLADGRLSLPGLVGETIPLKEIGDGLLRLQRGEVPGARLVIDLR